MRKILIVFLMFTNMLLSTEALGRNVLHAVRRENACFSELKDFQIAYDTSMKISKYKSPFGYGGASTDLSNYRIPDIAHVQWEESNGKFHVADVPIKRLLSPYKFKRGGLIIFFDVCNDQLTVYFHPNMGEDGDDYVYVWPENKAHRESTEENFANLRKRGEAYRRWKAQQKAKAVS